MLLLLLGLIFTLFSLPLFGVSRERYNCNRKGDAGFYCSLMAGCFCLLAGPICLWFGWPTTTTERLIAVVFTVAVAFFSVVFYRNRTKAIACSSCSKVVLDKYIQRRFCHICNKAFCLDCEPARLLNSLCAACDQRVKCTACGRIEGKSHTKGWVDDVCTDCLVKMAAHLAKSVATPEPVPMVTVSTARRFGARVADDRNCKRCGRLLTFNGEEAWCPICNWTGLNANQFE